MLVGSFVLAPLARVRLDALVDAVPTAGSDSRCGERCAEGVDLGELILDDIEQMGHCVDAAVSYAAVSSMAADNWSSSNRRSEDWSWISRQNGDVRAAGRLARILTRGLAAPILRSDHEPVLVHQGTRDDVP